MQKILLLVLALTLTACGQIGLEGQILTPTVVPSPTAIPRPSASPPPPIASPTLVASVTLQASATPEATTPPLAIETWSSASPDGQWRVEGEYAPDGQGTDNIRLTLRRADGSAQWLLVDRHEPGGLGQMFPKYFYWSPGGRYLYFANESTADGCALFTARHDFYRVDLQAKTPALETLLAFEDRAWAVALAPDEQSIAYLNSADGRWVSGQLNIKNLLSRQVITEKVTNDTTLSWNLTWSPDSQFIALNLTSTNNACDLLSASLTQFDTATLKQQRVLIANDSRGFQISAWDTPNTLALRDRTGGVWTFDVTTGIISPHADSAIQFYWPTNIPSSFTVNLDNSYIDEQGYLLEFDDYTQGIVTILWGGEPAAQYPYCRGEAELVTVRGVTGCHPQGTGGGFAVEWMENNVRYSVGGLGNSKVWALEVAENLELLDFATWRQRLESYK